MESLELHSILINFLDNSTRGGRNRGGSSTCLVLGKLELYSFFILFLDDSEGGGRNWGSSSTFEWCFFHLGKVTKTD